MTELRARLSRAVTRRVDAVAIWLSVHGHTGLAWFLWKVFRLV